MSAPAAGSVGTVQAEWTEREPRPEIDGRLAELLFSEPGGPEQ